MSIQYVTNWNWYNFIIVYSILLLSVSDNRRWPWCFYLIFYYPSQGGLEYFKPFLTSVWSCCRWKLLRKIIDHNWRLFAKVRSRDDAAVSIAITELIYPLIIGLRPFNTSSIHTFAPFLLCPCFLSFALVAFCASSSSSRPLALHPVCPQQKPTL